MNVRFKQVEYRYQAMKRIKRTIRAFTLIELLVVIAIISILAGLIFPVFAQAKRAAKTTTTISNIRQVSTSFALYAQDNDDGLPGVCDGPDGQNKEGGWIYYSYYNPNGAGIFVPSKGALYPYTKSSGVYVAGNDPDVNNSKNSFAYNGCLIKKPFDASGFNPSETIGQQENQSGMMLLGEEGSESGGHFDQYSGGTNDGFFSPQYDHFSQWNNGQTVVSFLDTHAKSVKARSNFRNLVWGNPDKPCWDGIL